MLSEREEVDFLIGRGLLSPLSMVEGNLAIHDVSRRNRNFKIVAEGGPSYLVKQAGGSLDPAPLAHEAAIYEAVASRPRDPLRPYMPRFHGYHAEHAMLVLGLVDRGRSLAEHQARGRFSTEVARGVGRALGALHSGPP